VLQKYKEREKEHDLDLKTKMPKCMAIAFFYRPKFRTIDLITNCWVGWPPLDLVTLLIFLSAENVITNFRIWIDSLHKSSGKLSKLSNKIRIGAIGLLELEIWAKHWKMSGLHDRFRLLCRCYHLNLKMTLLNLGLFMKVLGLCLSFP